MDLGVVHCVCGLSVKVVADVAALHLDGVQGDAGPGLGEEMLVDLLVVGGVGILSVQIITNVAVLRLAWAVLADTSWGWGAVSGVPG